MPDSVTRLKPGDKAPPFALRDQHGNVVKRSDFNGEKVFVYFYPKADTPGCTTQSCEVRDALPAFKDSGDLKVVGISPDPPERQSAFDEKYSLGYPLLSDPDHAVALAYGVWGEKMNYGKKYMGIIRSAFLIDERGRIEAAWYKVSPKDTVPKVLRALGA